MITVPSDPGALVCYHADADAAAASAAAVESSQPRAPLTRPAGLVTDYGSSMVQWMRTRRPRYRGEHRMEVERPSASFTVDVSIPQEHREDGKNERAEERD